MADVGDRLGRGPSAPFRREKGDYAMTEGPDLIAENSKQVVGVHGMSSDGVGGEYPWRMTFGGQAMRLRHLNIRKNRPSLEADVGRVMLADAIERWEPRARVFIDQIELGLPVPNSRKLDLKVVVSPVTDDDGSSIQEDRRVVTLEVDA